MADVACFGNETSVFDCNYTLNQVSCTDAVNIRCMCTACQEKVQVQPTIVFAETGSGALLQLALTSTGSAGAAFPGNIQIIFLSSKNPKLLLMTLRYGEVVVMDTDFSDRITFVTDNLTTIGINVSEVRKTDIGTFAIYARDLSIYTQILLFVTDVASGPGPVVRANVNDAVTLRYDLSLLYRVMDFDFKIHVRSPKTGRLRIDTYINEWVPDNFDSPVNPLLTEDPLLPTFYIDHVQPENAGLFEVELSVTPMAQRRLNFTRYYRTQLEVIVSDGFNINPSVTTSSYNHHTDINSLSVKANSTCASTANNSFYAAKSAAITLGVLVGLAIVLVPVLIYVIHKYKKDEIRRKDEQNNDTTNTWTADEDINITEDPPQAGQNNVVNQRNNHPCTGRRNVQMHRTPLKRLRPNVADGAPAMNSPNEETDRYIQNNENDNQELYDDVIVDEDRNL
jgi:hypothetical protein